MVKAKAAQERGLQAAEFSQFSALPSISRASSVATLLQPEGRAPMPEYHRKDTPGTAAGENWIAEFVGRGRVDST